MEMQKILEQIEPSRYYNVNEIYRLGFVPWANNHVNVYRLVERDMKRDNVLRALVVEEYANGKRAIRIQGKNLKRYLEKVWKKTNAPKATG